jgi:hypothetical protein
MRKRIINIVLLALASVLVLAALSVNFLLRYNKDSLLGQLERALSHRISADSIDVTFTPFGARLKNFAIADDSTSSGGELLRAIDTQVELRYSTLVHRPIQDQKNCPRIPAHHDRSRHQRSIQLRAPGQGREKRADGAKRRKKSSTTTQDAPSFWVPSLNISNGTLRYRDLSSGNELTLTQIKLKVSDLKADEPVEIEFDAAVMVPKVNLRFNSRIGRSKAFKDYRDFPIDGAIHADALDLGKVNRALPQFRRSLPRHLRFDGIYDIKDLKFKGALNNLSLKGAITGTDASVRFE